MSPKQSKKPISEKRQAGDEASRDQLRKFDLSKFGKLLQEAVGSTDR